MRVLQLIDTLRAGGAESVAIHIANSLAESGIPSYLCATREEGPLQSKLNKEVGYISIARTSTFDRAALLKLKKFVAQNKITHIHAHGTSYFVGTLCKIMKPRVKLIWHEHYGANSTTKWYHHKMLFICSMFFSGILTVNEDLKHWVERTFWVSKVAFIVNFIPNALFDVPDVSEKKNYIVCLANLREPKNHLLLIHAFEKLKSHNWKLQLVGADYNDLYSRILKTKISEKGLQDHVEILGVQQDAFSILKEASIGVLSSTSEGLPMALLEYGAASLAVVATDVGQCKEVVSTFGSMVPSNEIESMYQALLKYICDAKVRNKDAAGYKEQIKASFAASVVLPKIIKFYKSI